jgi:hypothetical protein
MAMQHALTNNAKSQKIQNSRSRLKVKITERVHCTRRPISPALFGHLGLVGQSLITCAVSSAPRLATSWSSCARVSSPPGGASRARAASSRLPDSTSLQHPHINIAQPGLINTKLMLTLVMVSGVQRSKPGVPYLR